MWKKIKKFLRPWPKTICFEVRDGDCQLLDTMYAEINSWNEVMPLGTQFCQDVMSCLSGENIDEVYWRYEEV